MKLEDYLNYLCQNRKCSREELITWMNKMELRAGPCDYTDYSNCKGWRLYFAEEFESEEEFLKSTCNA